MEYFTFYKSWKWKNNATLQHPIKYTELNIDLVHNVWRHLFKIYSFWLKFKKNSNFYSSSLHMAEAQL